MNAPANVLADAASPEIDRDAVAYDAMERRVTEALSDAFDHACRRPWPAIDIGNDARALAQEINMDDTDWLALIIVAHVGLGDDSVEGTVTRMMERARVLWTADQRRRARMRSALRLRAVQGFES